jgi:hypothetical protein
VTKNPRRTTFGLLATAVLSTTGCYTYTLTTPDTAAPGEGVRVLMTREGAAELAEVTQVAWEAPVVDGTLVGREGDDLLLSVAVGPRDVGFVGTDLRQTVRVPTSGIVTFQRRSLNVTNTVLSLAGVTAAGVGLVAYIVSEHRDGGNGGEPPPPDDLRFRFRLFSLSFGR